ncbi:hypothetical protein V8C37DRAFT_396449 [Trichoderma ceciliae]
MQCLYRCSSKSVSTTERVLCKASTIMSQSYNWPNDDDTDTQSPRIPSSHSEESQPATPAVRSRLRPAGKTPCVSAICRPSFRHIGRRRRNDII